MERFKGFASLLTAVLIFFVVLRLIHVVVPVFYPRVLAGPFSLDRLEEVRDYAGFSRRVPFYRPETLGARPVNITVSRRPYPNVVVFWQGDHFLRLEEQRGGRLPPAPEGDLPLPNHPEAVWWRQGRTIEVLLPEEGMWIGIRTDLDLKDVVRVVDTLRPLEELR